MHPALPCTTWPKHPVLSRMTLVTKVHLAADTCPTLDDWLPWICDGASTWHVTVKQSVRDLEDKRFSIPRKPDLSLETQVFLKCCQVSPYVLLTAKRLPCCLKQDSAYPNNATSTADVHIVEEKRQDNWFGLWHHGSNVVQVPSGSFWHGLQCRHCQIHNLPR